MASFLKVFTIAALLMLGTTSRSLVGAPHPTGTTIPLDKVPVETFSPPDTGKLETLAASTDTSGAYIFAEPIDATISPWTHGVWETLPDGERLWRVRIASPGALSLNLGFLDYWMPEGGSLYLYSLDGKLISGPFGAGHNSDHRQFWTPVVESDEIVIEVVVPGEKEGDLDLFLTSVNHGFLPFSASVEKSGNCNVDVACPEADPWRDQVNSVARYTFGGSGVCSGALINNTSGEIRQYFLTANHCNVNANNAPSMVIYWNYENSICRPVGTSANGGRGDGPLNRTSHGATLRARSGTADFALVEINHPINPDYNPYFAGWSRSTTPPQSVVCIHHPRTNEKRISFASQISPTNYLNSAVDPNGTHWRVHRWDIGTTEPGSSGSPLFNQNGLLVGQLHGGYASCTSDTDDWYGRIDRSWEGGGTSASRLRDWLDPDNTGLTSIPGRGLWPFTIGEDGPQIDDSPPRGDGDGIAEPGEELLLWVPLVSIVSEITTSPIGLLAASITPTVEILEGEAIWPDIGPGETVQQEIPFRIRVQPDHPCGEPVFLEIRFELDDGSVVVLPISIPTGPVCNFLPLVVLQGNPLLEDTLGNGNGNGIADPGESSLELTITLQNVGKPLPSMGYTLEAVTPTVYIQPSSSRMVFPNLDNGEQANNIFPYIFGVESIHPCGDPIDLQLVADDPDVPPIPIHLITTLETGLHYQLEPPYRIGPDPEIHRLPIPIESSSMIDSLRVTLHLPHTRVSDLRVRLLSPSDTSVLLFDPDFEGGSGLLNTTFDDAAPLEINEGEPPFTGSFRPIEPLSAFASESLEGVWYLEIEDMMPDEGGVLEFVELSFIVTDAFKTDDSNGEKAFSPYVTSVHPRQPIGPSPEVVYIEFPVEESGTIRAVNPMVNITHTWVGDLILAITSPEGTTVNLFNQHGGSGRNLIGTIFDDNASVAIQNGSAPFTGRFRPFSPLSIFEGESITGTWIFRIEDALELDGGTIDMLELELHVNKGICEPIEDVTVEITDSKGVILHPGESVVEFGAHLLNGIHPTESIKLRNTSNVKLLLFGATLPEGFILVSTLPKSIPPGGEIEVTISLSTEVLGAFEGDMILETNIPDKGLLPLTLTGSIVGFGSVETGVIDGDPAIPGTEFRVRVRVSDNTTSYTPASGAVRVYYNTDAVQWEGVNAGGLGNITLGPVEGTPPNVSRKVYFPGVDPPNTNPLPELFSVRFNTLVDGVTPFSIRVDEPGGADVALVHSDFTTPIPVWFDNSETIDLPRNVVTPTPTPTVTPTPTAPPIIPNSIEFTFEEDEEGWVFEHFPDFFDEVGHGYNEDRGSLDLTVFTNTNSYGTWASPIFTLTSDPGEVVLSGFKNVKRLSLDEEAGFRVIASIHSPFNEAKPIPPAVRLRASSLDFRQTHEMTITPSNNRTALAPTEDGRVYIQYFSQPEGIANFRLFFDVLNFSGTGSPEGTVGLDSLLLESLEPGAITEPDILVGEFNFADGETHGFTPRDASPVLRVPEVFAATADGLLIRGIDVGNPNEDTSPIHGFWGHEADLVFEADTIYMITWRVRTEATSEQADAIPTMRLRVNDSSLQLASLVVLDSQNGAHLPVDGQAEEYRQWIQTPDEIAGRNWIFSFDMLWTDRPIGDPSADDPTIGVIVESIRVEALALEPLE